MFLKKIKKNEKKKFEKNQSSDGVRWRQVSSGFVSLRQVSSGFVSLRQVSSGFVRFCQLASADACDKVNTLTVKFLQIEG
jgi:hypothetical protein